LQAHDHLIEPSIVVRIIPVSSGNILILNQNTVHPNLEATRSGFDLQYVVKGTERFGITSAEYAEPITEYKPDVTFYKAKKIKYVDSTPDTFFMFFPKNFHQALVKAGKEPEDIRVIVAKIEYIP
jgi:beta-galactosidase beta subunit